MTKRFMYKTPEECANLVISNRFYVINGEGYSCENDFPSMSYGVGNFDPNERIHSLSGDYYFSEAELFGYLAKAVSRRGITAVMYDSFESEMDKWSQGQPSHWGRYIYRPTFMVDGVLSVCDGMVDGKYSFISLSDFVKNLAEQEKRQDEYERELYESGHY